MLTTTHQKFQDDRNLLTLWSFVKPIIFTKLLDIRSRTGGLIRES